MGNRQKQCVLTTKDIQILSKTSGKSENEIRQWYNKFLQESNNTGRMNKQQFQVYYTNLKKYPNSDTISDHIFRAFDTDRSGSIDFQEFLIAYIATSEGTVRQKFEYAFEVYDINGDDMIERKEAKKILNLLCRIHGFSEHDAVMYTNTVMLTFDTNQDKFLSRTEFINGCLHDSALGHISNPFAI